MAIPRTIWVDLCRIPQRSNLSLDAKSWCDPRRVTRLLEIHSAIAAHRPQFVCIEYDYPDRTRLGAVTLIRRDYPALPVLTLTEYHSEALAIWAFRWRVWDYRVKPLTADTLARLIAAIARAGEQMQSHGWSMDLLPPDLVAPAGHLRSPFFAARRTAAVVAWVNEHFDEPIRLDTVARFCHLSESEFSRIFHREHGLPFRRFLLQYRIAKARDLLAEPDTSISQVASAVGFNDLSQFGRMFRRCVGVPATEYQRSHSPHA